MAQCCNSQYLSDWTHSFAEWSENSILVSNKGKYMTEAIAMSGYAKSASRLRQVYRENSQAIDSYFDEVDTPKVVAQILRTQVDNAKDKVNSNLPIIIGIAAAVAGIGYIVGR